MNPWKRSQLNLAMAGALALSAAAASAGQITLYEGSAFRGPSMATSTSLPNTEQSPFRYVASSVIVNEGTWEACTAVNFRGRCAQLTPGNYANLRSQLEGPVTSVREVVYASGPVRIVVDPDTSPPAVPDARPVVTAPVAPLSSAARITLYEHGARGIRAVDLASNVDDLDSRHFDNRADAAFITGGVWRLCDGRLGRGSCADFSPGRYETLGTLNGHVNSAYLIGTMPDRPVSMAPSAPAGRVVLYEYPNFGGASAVVDANRAPDLDWANFKNAATSLRIESGTWLVCSNIGYQGDCRVLDPGDYPVLTGLLDQGVYSARQVWRPEYGSAERYQRRWLP